ncbi:MAG: prolipoprotein diacylglyceryl transferase [Monoglobales bacterium]
MNTIAFPKLGLNMKIDPVAFHIGGKEIYWYALIILTGFILGALFVLKTCRKRGVNPDNVYDIAMFGLIAGIIGARLYYVLFSLDEFDSFWDVFKIWNGGLAIYGGIIGAFISTAIYCKIKNLNVLNVFDVCCPGLLIGQLIGRWGNFVNAEVFGRETSLPWGMSINGNPPVHPLFLYESLWNLLGFIIIVCFRNKKTANGQVICFYILWYSVGRLFLEGMRNSSFILYVIPNVLAISQLVACIGIILSVVCFIIFTRKFKINR